MPKTCVVSGCSSHAWQKEHILFYRIPTKECQKRMLWIQALRRMNKDGTTWSPKSKWSYVCSKHFVYGKPHSEPDHPDFVPSIFMYSSTSTSKKSRSESSLPLASLSSTSQRDGIIKPITSPAAAVNEILLTTQQSTTETLEDPDTVVKQATQTADTERASYTETDNLRQEAHKLQNLKSCNFNTELIKDDNEKSPNTTEAAAEMELELMSQRIDEERQECGMGSLRLKKITNLLEENRKLKEELSKKNLEENFLKDNDSKVKFYTGLPSFALFMDVLMQIRHSLPNTDLKISHFQMLLLTLMRLRLNLQLDHVAHLFDTSRTTASTLFNSTVNVLHTHLSPLVRWPMSHCTQLDDRVIEIDCFELFIERAQNPCSNTEIYSSSKNRHTLKYLIGITPQGTISYISKGWGGRSSDKHIAENSGFLQKLSPGDVVLADQRFDIKESVTQMGATLKISALTQSHSQQDTKGVKEAQRTHVKRVIGCIRSKYTMLNDTMQLGLVVPCEEQDMTLLDKIVAVSCALTNMCPSDVLK